MKYYLIAGEASGDLHASNLMKEIREMDTEADFRYWGGDLMKQQGGELVKHYRDLAFMGFVEVLLNIREITGNLKHCKQDILDYHPDAIILIDYPGFNLRIAKFGKTAGLRVIYYISPQLWAWRSSRVRIIKRYVDKMFVILPFEKEFYARYDYPVEFVGHPLLDHISDEDGFTGKESFLQEHDLDRRPVVALLPGSRKQEISRALGIMSGLVPDFQDFQFMVGGVSSIPPEFYRDCLKDVSIPIVYNQTYNLLKHSDAALVTSGTATLETALMGVPQVVCYRGSPLSYLIARMIVHVKYISLVNLIMDKKVIAELIQGDFNKNNLAFELHQILYDRRHRDAIIQDYTSLEGKLGGKGASAKAADLIVQYLKKITV